MVGPPAVEEDGSPYMLVSESGGGWGEAKRSERGETRKERRGVSWSESSGGRD